MKLAELQQQFQNALLTGNRDVLSVIPDSPREIKETLFQVYADAYVIRLAGALKDEYEKLHAVMGDEAFDLMARTYLSAHPSHFRSARHVGSAMPQFLKQTAPYNVSPVLSELAQIETAMNDAFDAKDADPLMLAALAATPAELWGDLVFTSHPSAHLVSLETNALAQWKAVAEGSHSPDPAKEAAHHLLVWRQDLTVHYRRLEAEEAMLWMEADKGASFGALCELAAVYDDPGAAPLRAATYLKGWIESALLASATSPERETARS